MKVNITTKPDMAREEFDRVHDVRIDDDGDLILHQQNITITCPAADWEAYAVQKETT